MMTDHWAQALADGGFDEGLDLLQHLLMDRLIKAAIVMVALIVLGVGMVVVWKQANRRR
jgi:hypothetical protein